MLYDYELVTPGPKVDSFTELLQALQSALDGGLGFVDQRRWLKRLFHAYNDGNASRRIAEHLRTVVG